MPLNKPSVLIPNSDELLSRQIQELMKALEPLFSGASQADKDWSPITVTSPWTAYGPMKMSSKKLLSGAVTAKGLLSTTGGESRALAVKNGSLVYPSSNFISLASPAKILTFPVKPAEDFYLPLQAVFAYDTKLKSFYGSALLSIKKDGTMSLEQIIGSTDISFAIGWLQIEFMRIFS